MNFIIIILFFITESFSYSTYYNGELSLNTSTYSSTSHEYVYDNNKKISELIWDITNIPLIELELGLYLKKDINLNISYAKGISNDSKMDDFDWLKDYTTDWSDWSHHENTKLENLSLFDINVEYIAPYFYSIKPIITTGYKIEQRSFNAYNGNFIYTEQTSNDPNDFRQTKGSFTGLGISYNERIEVLYFKLGLKKQFKKLHIHFGLAYSPFVRMYNNDTHHFREFTNINIFNYTSMIEYSLGIEYIIHKNILLSFNYNNTNYKEAIGTTTRNYYSQGTIIRYDGAGISSNSHKITYLKLKFIL